MSTFESPSLRRPLRTRDERFARVYELEIHPLIDRRLDQLLLRALASSVGTAALADAGDQVLELGCGAGALTCELIPRLHPEARLVVTAPSTALLELARKRIAEQHPARRVFLRVHDAHARLPFADESFALVIARLAPQVPAVAPDEDDASGAGPAQHPALADLVRVLRPGGRLVMCAPLAGTWREFIDLFREVLIQRWDLPALAALERYLKTMPELEGLAAPLESLGVRELDWEVDRWELLFRSGREFLYAPVIELGPLPTWKSVAGRGEAMQAIFVEVQQAIDTYFARRSFATTVVAGCLTGTRGPGTGAP